ncbi:hypothetical protein CesoFtcFv8_012168 [Champsocephalus esox]|uniref:Carboxylic ester hydrolase n=1 Tax=Champsocephalus esox TaxID=159716 RepID=A0AAN8BUX6_9TELE|nr:hypothetical protein CesoFtcFv8_012168 [Champsocephalus esox]
MMNTKSLVAIAVFLETVSAISLGLVNIEGGLVRGENMPLASGRHMDVFRGIPFADVPETFMKPKPHPGWDDVLDTTVFKDICLQVSVAFNLTRGSTDCLYLNIWVPHNGSVSSDMPVMVWIYGGAFMIGSSMGTHILSFTQFSGQELADRGNVIVVSIGYRVGSLGFLSTGDPNLPVGNYGLWDQQAAIAWVHRNIRKFGGDPESITIFGESAGGASVSLQVLIVTGRTYSYLFSEPSQMAGIFKPFPKWMGADHTDDVPFVFGKPFSAALMYLAHHRDLSGYMIAYWANFARTGDPNEGERSAPATWPTFNSTGQNFVELNSKMDESSVGENMRMPFVDLWNNVIPSFPDIIPE